MRKRNHAFLLLAKNGRSLRFRRYSLKNIPGHRMIKQLLNSVVAKYRDLSYLPKAQANTNFDLLATDKSRYFAQPRPTIVKYLLYCVNVEKVQSTD